MAKKSLKESMIDFVFNISKQPVRYKDLLAANALYNEGMYVDPAKLNFRISIAKAYFVYAIICTIILAPLVLIFHFIMPNSVDFHVPITGSILGTSAVFVGFYYFKAWLRDAITLKLIKKAWQVHFPYFVYEKYNKPIEEIYNEIRRKELPRREWEQFVFDELIDK